MAKSRRDVPRTQASPPTPLDGSGVVDWIARSDPRLANKDGRIALIRSCRVVFDCVSRALYLDGKKAGPSLPSLRPTAGIAMLAKAPGDYIEAIKSLKSFMADVPGARDRNPSDVRKRAGQSFQNDLNTACRWLASQVAQRPDELVGLKLECKDNRSSHKFWRLIVPPNMQLTVLDWSPRVKTKRSAGSRKRRSESPSKTWITARDEDATPTSPNGGALVDFELIGLHPTTFFVRALVRIRAFGRCVVRCDKCLLCIGGKRYEAMAYREEHIRVVLKEDMADGLKWLARKSHMLDRGDFLEGYLLFERNQDLAQAEYKNATVGILVEAA